MHFILKYALFCFDIFQPVSLLFVILSCSSIIISSPTLTLRYALGIFPKKKKDERLRKPEVVPLKKEIIQKILVDIKTFL